MRIAISNIAWDVSDDDQIAELLLKYKVDAIDIAPGKYFPEPTKVTDNDIANIKYYWLNKGIEIVGMQSLLFGKQSLNIFGSKQSQKDMLDHLSAITRIAEKLGISRLVFGSPKNRDRIGFSDEQALTIAKDFFTKLGNIANKHGVVFCLEPCPKCYGSNFMTTSLETFDVVSAIKHPAIKMQLDIGAITINKEPLYKILPYCLNQVGYIHISEPGLSVVGDGNVDHKSYAKILNMYLNNQIVSIEMLATKKEFQLVSIERSLAFVTQTYGVAL